MEGCYYCWKVRFWIFRRSRCVQSSLYNHVLLYQWLSFICIYAKSWARHEFLWIWSFYYNSSKNVCVCCLFIIFEIFYICMRSEVDYRTILLNNPLICYILYPMTWLLITSISHNLLVYLYMYIYTLKHYQHIQLSLYILHRPLQIWNLYCYWIR